MPHGDVSARRKQAVETATGSHPSNQHPDPFLISPPARGVLCVHQYGESILLIHYYSMLAKSADFTLFTNKVTFVFTPRPLHRT